MDFTTIRWEVRDGIGWLTFNRPEAVNAFSATMLTELRGALDLATRDDAVRVLILTGVGRGFSAGQDLKEHVAGTPEAIGEHLARYYNPVLERLYALQKPTLAAVNGAAAGAGMSVALACDLRIAADDARFLMAFVRIGLVPDSGASYHLPRLVGPARALELALLGEPVEAQEALRIGLVNRVVPRDRLLDEAALWGAKLAAGPPLAQTLIKRAMRRGAAEDFQAALEYEAWCQATAASSADHREGVAAFLEKRAPRFGGS